MAYPTVDKPYGFRPVNLIGGQVFSGSTRQYAIDTAHGTSIFYGDLVQMSSGGTLTRYIGTDAATLVLGVFMGCSYVNSAGQRVYSQYFPALTAGVVDSANMITGYVADDPDIVLRTAIVSSGTTISGRTRAALVGKHAVLPAYQAGSTITGNSLMCILSAVAATSTLPLKIIDVVPETSGVAGGVAAGSFTEVLVVYAPGVHFYRGSAV
jgi:hypothetical protein